MSQAEVGRLEDVSASTVSRIARDVNRTLPPSAVIAREVLAPLVEAMLSVPQMAEVLELDPGLVRRSLRRNRIRIVSNSWLRRRYGQEGATVKTLATEAGCSKSLIYRYLHQAGLDPQQPYRFWSETERAAVRAAVAAGESHLAVSRRTGIPRSTVSLILRRR